MTTTRRASTGDGGRSPSEEEGEDIAAAVRPFGLGSRGNLEGMGPAAWVFDSRAANDASREVALDGQMATDFSSLALQFVAFSKIKRGLRAACQYDAVRAFLLFLETISKMNQANKYDRCVCPFYHTKVYK